MSDSPAKFPLGAIVVTDSVRRLMNSDDFDTVCHDVLDGILFQVLPPDRTPKPITRILARHAAGDWGTMSPEDKKANDAALRFGDRLMSSYTLKGEKVWVITEWDRSKTTILLPEDY